MARSSWCAVWTLVLACSAPRETPAPPAEDPQLGTPGLQVLVVDEAGEPVPGARIVYVRASDVADFCLRGMRRYRGMDELRSALAMHTETDSRGRARLEDPYLVPRTARCFEATRVDAQAGPLWGFLEQAGVVDGRATIRLQRDESMTISVVDADGNPQPGVEVSLLRQLAYRDDIWATWGEQCWSGVASGADARVVFRHLQLYRDPLPSQRRLVLETDQWLLDGAVEPVEVELRDGAAVQVVSQPAHTVIVEVEDRAGRTVRDAEVTFEHLSSARGGDPAEVADDEGRWLVDGRAVFESAPLDVRFRIRANDGQYSATPFEGRTPRAAGGTPTRVFLVLDRPMLRLQGRALDPDGSPLQSACLRLSAGDGHETDVEPPVFTDREGRFVFALELPRPPTESRLRALHCFFRFGLRPHGELQWLYPVPSDEGSLRWEEEGATRTDELGAEQWLGLILELPISDFTEGRVLDLGDVVPGPAWLSPD